MTEVSQHRSSQQGVTLSPTAKKHFLTMLQKEPHAKGVRLSLKKTGCSGLSYVLDCVEKAEEGDLIFPLEGTPYAFFVAKAHYPTLKGLSIDFVKDGLNQKLVFSNPNQTGQCGCGESFTVE